MSDIQAHQNELWLANIREPYDKLDDVIDRFFFFFYPVIIYLVKSSYSSFSTAQLESRQEAFQRLAWKHPIEIYDLQRAIQISAASERVRFDRGGLLPPSILKI